MINMFLNNAIMWYKINNLSQKHFSQAQISRLLGISRNTVHRYLMMSKEEFDNYLSKVSCSHPCKLDPYREFITQELHEEPSLSCPQILDHLKENFPYLPYVSDRTVYNYVMRVREEENLPKTMSSPRQMCRIPDCEYGEKVQVDFGEKIMRNPEGRAVKVYFFSMVFMRSRYKFVYFQNIPFTAKTTAYAHHLAFNYFGGMPQIVVYDQDKKMLFKENYGDYIMTEDFAKYVAEAGFEPIFCMPYDPQSKGRIENVIRYVKQNFISGRKYVNLSCLNEEVIGWLSRTGNGKVHSVTKLVPAEEFKEEQKHLLPYTVQMDEPDSEARLYVVRKDNTLLYRSNFYNLPKGTYEHKGTKVLIMVDVDKDVLEIYKPADSSLIISYPICHGKGQNVTKDGISSVQSRIIMESENTLREYFNQYDEESPINRLLSAIKADRPRYYRKTVQAMATLFTDYDKATGDKLLACYLEKNVYNANVMAEIAKTMSDKVDIELGDKMSSAESLATQSIVSNRLDLMPDKRSIDEYSTIINLEGE